MNHPPEGRSHRRDSDSGRNPDEESTEVVGDAYDYFFAPRSSRAGSERPAGAGPPPRRSGRASSGQRSPGGPSGDGPGRSKLRRRVLIALALVGVLIAAVLLYVNSALPRVAALEGYGERPAGTPGQTWLLVGSDSREELSPGQRQKFNTGKAAGGRTDTIMVLHVSRFGGRTTLVSLPRDSLVDIPAYEREGEEDVPAQEGKLNTAFALGGPPLLARTVEQETGLRMDHYMNVGFAGFAGVVNAVGGVRLCLEQPINDPKAGANLDAGCQRLNGEEALAYVRSRSFARGDLARVQHQRKFLRALTDEVASPGTLLNPFAMAGLTRSGLDALAVDKESGPLDLLWLTWQLRGLTGGDGVTMSVPVARTGSVSGVGSVVLWERQQALALFEALQQDKPVPSSVRQG